MSGFIVRDEDNAVIGVVAGVHAVWSPNERQQHNKCRRNVRASLAESMEHRNTTVPVRLRHCQVHDRWYVSAVLIMMLPCGRYCGAQGGRA